MQDANNRFVELANPHSWLLTVDNLHSQAMVISHAKGQSRLTFVDHRNGTNMSWDGVNRATFLLGGFALENAIKAFLVYENPAWISNGSLARPLRSHSLTVLQGQATTIPFKNRCLWVLRQFEEGIDSWSRYPCALTAAASSYEGHMTAGLWRGYLRLIRAYGNRLTKLLARGWHGPHGFYGSWRFEGEFLSITS